MSIFAKGIEKNIFNVKNKTVDPHPLQFPYKLKPGVRYSLQQLQLMYDNGRPEPLEDVVIAFKGIIDKDPDDPFSFFYIGGLHGAPLELRDPADVPTNPNTNQPEKYWGGWCNHANVLFPTWHRVYCRYIEKALQSVVPGVTLPFLDETGEDAYYTGIPTILTDEKILIKGKWIDNPLRSFTLPETLPDNYGPDNHKLRKEKGYQTVRHPYSGLVGNDRAKRRTAKWNAQFTYEEATEMLNDNFKQWLRVIEDPDGPDANGCQYQYVNSLTAPNYTVFSNTASVNQYNTEHAGTQFSLEGPHNNVHLAIGGYTELTNNIFVKKGDRVLVGANGDMGNNNTAGLDPIFFFHHCFVDYVFWQWQRRNGFTESFDIVPGYLGTNSSKNDFVDAQGPAVGQLFNEDLTMKSPLLPFKTRAGDYVTSEDTVNILKMGYDFGPGSLDLLAIPNNPYASIPLDTRKKLHITKITRSKFRGSFVLYAFAEFGGEQKLIGQYAIFSRYDIEYCENCQKHLDINAIIPIGHKLADEILDGTDLKSGVEVILKYQSEDEEGEKHLVEARDDDFAFDIMV